MIKKHCYNFYLSSKMEAGFPDMVKVTNIKTTYEGRQIKLVHVSLDLAETSKQPAIFIDCGIHAREWVSPAFCLYTIDRLVDEGKVFLVVIPFFWGSVVSYQWIFCVCLLHQKVQNDELKTSL